MQAGNVIPVEHYAATTQTALLALQAIDEVLSTLPAVTSTAAG